jgi:hypothetical protein
MRVGPCGAGRSPLEQVAIRVPCGPLGHSSLSSPGQGTDPLGPRERRAIPCDPGRFFPIFQVLFQGGDTIFTHWARSWRSWLPPPRLGFAPAAPPGPDRGRRRRHADGPGPGHGPAGGGDQAGHAGGPDPVRHGGPHRPGGGALGRGLRREQPLGRDTGFHPDRVPHRLHLQGPVHRGPPPTDGGRESSPWTTG